VTILDEYEIRARLFPALLTVASLPIIVVALGFREEPLVTSLLALFTAIGGPLVLAYLVREQGGQLQEKLFSDWGGPPTTALLRAEDQGERDSKRLQRRRAVEKVWGSSLPSREDEVKDPVAADEVYESAVSWLREHTRDKKVFPLVFSENCNYGFHRNLLALKPAGIVFTGVGCLALVGVIIANLWLLSLAWFELLGGLAACGAVLALWLTFPTERRVRGAGETYAARLLDASLNITPQTSTSVG
jgi:hypothetical protein